MKKIIMLFVVLGFWMNLRAQLDGFFVYQYEYRDERDEEWAQILLLPEEHGLDYNVPVDVPLGSGLLLLTGMSIGYGIMIKNNRKR